MSTTDNIIDNITDYFDARILVDNKSKDNCLFLQNGSAFPKQLITINYCATNPDVCIDFDEGLGSENLSGNYTNVKGYVISIKGFVKYGFAIIGNIMRVIEEKPILTSQFNGKYFTTGGPIKERTLAVIVGSEDETIYVVRDAQRRYGILTGKYYYYDETSNGFKLHKSDKIDTFMFELYV